MSQAFNRAVQLHRAGNLDGAELVYRQLLDDDPNHADALHLLGVIAHQRGNPGRAVTLIRRAVAIDGTNPIYHCNLAESCRVSGDLSEAVTHSRKAIRLLPHHADAHNHLGLALQGQGQLTEAIASFREAVTLRPDFALGHNNLGGALREAGARDEALAAFRTAVGLNPDLPLARSNLGQLLLETGARDEALEHCRAAVRLLPNFPEGLSNLGNALRAADNMAEAKECYRKALALRPDAAMIHGNMGQALQEEGNLDQAVAYYRTALELDAKSPRFECYLAGALVQKEDLPGAAVHYRRALELKPDFPEAHNGLGQVLHELGDLTGAIGCYREALRLKPDFADAYSNLGGAHAERGEMELANAAYRDALRCDPEYVGAYGVLATHLRAELPQADVDAMHAFLGREHLTDWKRALLHHGLAHVYDARRDYAAAGDHARDGNALRKQVWERQGKVYNRTEHHGFVTFLMKQFSPAFFARTAGWGLDTEVPVFVFGVPRSGTTLIEQIVASHPRAFGAGELPYAKESFDSLPKLLKVEAAPSVCVPHLTREHVRHVGQAHLARLRELDAGALRVVDKMPDNYLWLGFLAAVFPRAKFVYARRDFNDIAVSCWMTNFKSIRWACDPDDIAQRVRDHRRIMDHWRAVLPVPMLELDYEDTVADLEKTAKKLIAFCGLEWDPACLAFHETKRTVRTASLSQVRQPIYARSVQRWKNYEPHLAPLFRLIADGTRP